MGTRRAPNARRIAPVVAVLLACAACAADGSKTSAGKAGGDATTTTTTEAGPRISLPAVPQGEGRGDVIPDEPAGGELPTSFVTLTEAIYGAFTAEVPDGWDSVAYTTVEGQMANNVLASVSPDGSTVIFSGDPGIPSYYDPDQATDVIRQFTEWVPSMELARYTPADAYLQGYVPEKFGGLDGFALDGIEPLPERAAQIEEAGRAAGGSYTVEAARARFSFTDEQGQPNRGYVDAVTMNGGVGWLVNVNGAATTGDLEALLPVALSVTDSIRMTPDFVANQQARHEATMAQMQAFQEEMTRRHGENMARLQQSAASHQARMEAIWASNDAQITAYYDRMQQGDVNHRAFLNYINEENTVVGPSGGKVQVAGGYERYWINVNDGSYLGGDAALDESALRELGFDPSAYQEAPIVRG